jgi:hypothetical protein
MAREFILANIAWSCHKGLLEVVEAASIFRKKAPTRSSPLTGPDEQKDSIFNIAHLYEQVLDFLGNFTVQLFVALFLDDIGNPL